MDDPPRYVHTPPRGYDSSMHVSAPYVTARPGTTWRSLSNTDEPKGSLKFIIAASDGRKYLFNSVSQARWLTSSTVWDLLSSEEAVGLVATHLEHPIHEPISRETVKSGLIRETEESKKLHPGPRPKGEERPGVWFYEDTNVATHLIRNAFNSSSAVANVRDMLSLKPPIARSFKDDVTCSYVKRVEIATLPKTFHLQGNLFRPAESG